MDSYVPILAIVVVAIIIYAAFLTRQKNASSQKENRFAEIRDRVESQRDFVKETIELYLKSHDCPCDWPQFIYWCGKQQGPGWQDGIQNDLVTEALKLSCFKDKREAEVNYGYEENIVCSSCGARWKYYSEEWRMLAYHESLTRMDLEGSVIDGFGDLVSENIFQTVGFSPDDSKKSLSIQEWREFTLSQSPNKQRQSDA